MLCTVEQVTCAVMCKVLCLVLCSTTKPMRETGKAEEGGALSYVLLLSWSHPMWAQQ